MKLLGGILGAIVLSVIAFFTGYPIVIVLAIAAWAWVVKQFKG